MADYESTQAQLEIQPDPNLDDEGYQETSASSLLSSLASEVRRGVLENGRLYASYGQHEYALPIDDDELDRLDLNHTKYQLMYGGKLFLAPIPDDPQKVLDVGCGTGLWCIDIADKYNSAEVIGIDIAPVQPQWVPPNCQFQIDDAEQDWTFGFNTFDFIHCRDMYVGIRDFRKFIRQCFDHVKPGGWVEICSVYPIPRADDGTLPADAAILELSQTFRAISIRMGADSEFQLKLKDWFTETGFEGVVEQIFKIPSSPWAKDATMKKIGAFQLMNVVEGASGFLHRGWTKDFGQTREELELLVMRLRKELSANKFHCYAPFYSVYGQKPHNVSSK